eukprot:436009-Pleurochrysis_carterae.AAC.1
MQECDSCFAQSCRARDCGSLSRCQKNESLRGRGVGRDKSSPASRRARSCGSFTRQHLWLRRALLARK